MFELTINEAVHCFNPGIGFFREINKKNTVEYDNGIKEDIGFRESLIRLLDGDIVEFENQLLIANKYQSDSPKLTQQALDDFIDSDDDLDAHIDAWIDFLKQNGCTKKVTLEILEIQEKQKEKQE